MIAERIRDNLAAVRGRMAESARRAGRDVADVTLVAVTKRNPPAWIRPLVALGVRDLAENYPQELWDKAAALADLPINWHLIGHLQGNKAKRTYPMVRCIHGVDSLKLLRTLAIISQGFGDHPAILLQVNTSGEAAKHGWSPAELLADAEYIDLHYSGDLAIEGLMTMAPYGASADEARRCFVRLRELRDELRTRTYIRLPWLSMGMSGDFEVAIEEGATLIRVGSALFEGIAP